MTDKLFKTVEGMLRKRIHDDLTERWIEHLAENLEAVMERGDRERAEDYISRLEEEISRLNRKLRKEQVSTVQLMERVDQLRDEIQDLKYPVLEGSYSWIVLFKKDGDTPLECWFFGNRDDADKKYDELTVSWTEVMLCKIERCEVDL